MPSKSSTPVSEVILNVYDTSPANSTTYYLGLGRFHSGMVVYGKEYIFRFPDGITEISPRSAGIEGIHKLRRSITIGVTTLSKLEVDDALNDLTDDFQAEKYDPIMRNSNHFCDALSLRLCKKTIPDWVGRLSDIIAFFNYYPTFPLVTKQK